MSVKLDLGFMTFDLREIPAYARRAEELGVGALWSAETKHDPFLPLAVAAANTSGIQLGTAIAVAFPRSPMILAHTAWDLQKVSGGRFVLGLGTQVKAHNERRFSLKWEPPGPRLREVVLALRAIWESWQTGAPLNFRGQSYRFDLMTPFFNPGPIEHPRIPIYIAAVNPYMAQMAGEICDGLHVHSFHSPKYLREVIRPAVEAGLAKSGRRLKDFTFRASTMVVVGNDAEELGRNKRAVKQQIAFYASTRTYQAVLAVHGLDHLVPQLHAKSLEGDWEGMADLISDETLDHFALTATWDTLGAKLRQRYDGICDRTQLYPAFQPSLDDPRLQALIKEMNG
ncbi:MAG TPA: TIGR03617 family F420-dependent LLM class oxidoreductase [Methylomirabilota bacterium]|nr:TIGR03617 family F420-dependent LLM class oxidoreductase [Methylomirabilota bacterium]